MIGDDQVCTLHPARRLLMPSAFGGGLRAGGAFAPYLPLSVEARSSSGAPRYGRGLPPGQPELSAGTHDLVVRVYGARGREVMFVTKKYFCDVEPKYFVTNAT